MLDIGWSEMLVIGVVALIVVGPKDLPKMFHTLGEVTGKARGMAREFQRAMDAAAKETGVNDIVKDFKRTASGQSIKEAAGLDEIEKEFREIGAARPDVRKAGKPVLPGDIADDAGDESAGDEAVAAAHDADLAARNAELSASEALRLKRDEAAAEARQRAAGQRAAREAESADAPAPRSPDPDA